MNQREIINRIAKLKTQITSLPSGSVTKKRVNGRIYFYHRFSVDGKRKEKYIPADEVENLRQRIDYRKSLQSEVKELENQLPETSYFVEEAPFVPSYVSDVSAPYTPSMPVSGFSLSVRIGSELRKLAAAVKGYKKRECFGRLHDYVYGQGYDKVFILYGLRRTGKTTLIRQIFNEMTDEELGRTAFIQVMPQDTMADLNRDLRILERNGFRYVFIDEVTLIEDFIEGAALLSDIFAAGGMKIVLSGTDSLGFVFAEDEQLYDRCILAHTTFIPYREFDAVLGIHGIDEYIRYGGTMSLGGTHYNETSTFSTKKKTDEYVDTAIAENIQHSLKHYQHGGHFRSLRELYEENELTGAINRVVEDMNHRFTMEVLTRDFKSSDLSVSAGNLRRDRENPTDILDRVNVSEVTENLKKLLEIRDKSEQTVKIEESHAAEIREYLDLLDMTGEVEVRYLPDVSRTGMRTVISQPGIRYAQAGALIRSLLLDETFKALSFPERNYVQQRILSEIKGRMMEDIVLLETKLANPDKEVFVLQFPVGEFDMVVADYENGTCEIFEIKHSDRISPEQYRHLADEEKCALAEHRYGRITKKTVLYRGEPAAENGIEFENVESYLLDPARLSGRRLG